MAKVDFLKPAGSLRCSAFILASNMINQEIYGWLKTFTGLRKAGCKEIEIISLESTES